MGEEGLLKDIEDSILNQENEEAAQMFNMAAGTVVVLILGLAT